MGSHPHPTRLNPVRRAFAAAGAVLTLVLCLFAASPVLHQQLHHGTNGSYDDGCAVVLFANGVSVPLTIAAPAPPSEIRQTAPILSPEILLDSPRYLLKPGRGPPRA